MLKNIFKTAYRNLKKNKFISFIKLFGWTVGLTCCLLILSYILYELSFDRYNKDAVQVYRVTRTFYNGSDPDFKRLFEIGVNCLGDSLSGSLVRHGQVAPGLCLPDPY